MRVVVTGATGNLGTALLRRLTSSGAHDVVGLARRIPAAPPEGVAADRVRWVSVDLTTDAAGPLLTEAFSDADAVVHLAWGFEPSHNLTDGVPTSPYSRHKAAAERLLDAFEGAGRTTAGGLLRPIVAGRILPVLSH